MLPLKYPGVTPYRPFGAKYDTTYVVFAVTAIGDANVACCQPEPDSFVNVTEPKFTPADDQRLPTCVPVFDEYL